MCIHREGHLNVRCVGARKIERMPYRYASVPEEAQRRSERIRSADSQSMEDDGVQQTVVKLHGRTIQSHGLAITGPGA